MKFTPKRIARLALMVAAVGATASIQIPIGPVPITLQTFFIALTGALLGPADGFVAMLAYLLLGCAGVPVFAGMTSGVSKLIGPTGGFLISYPFYCAMCGLFYRAERWQPHALCALGGLALLEVFGTVHLMLVGGMDLRGALTAGVWPFLAKDCACVLLAVFVARKIRPRIDAAR